MTLSPVISGAGSSVLLRWLIHRGSRQRNACSEDGSKSKSSLLKMLLKAEFQVRPWFPGASRTGERCIPLSERLGGHQRVIAVGQLLGISAAFMGMLRVLGARGGERLGARRES